MAVLPHLTDDEIIAQLDFEDGMYEYEWVGNTITFKFPTDVGETTSYDFDNNASEPGPEAEKFKPVDLATAALFRVAIQAWDDLIAPNFVEVSSGEADIEVAYTTTGIGYAHAYYPEENADPEFLTNDGGTVWLNSSFSTDGDPNDLVAAPVGSYGFNTYLHELGHAMGLDHMGDYSGSDEGPFSFQDTTIFSVMSYWGPAGPNKQEDSDAIEQADWKVGSTVYDSQTPMLSDVLAIQSMYGVSTTTRTGATTYGFNASGLGSMDVIFDFTKNTHPIVCIFDSSGIDTLDLSGFTGNNYISLVPGTLSSAGNSGGGVSESNNAMTNNISIAHSATIENAVGGSGNDSITGNVAANALIGGAGHDTLLGGAGNDTLTGGAGNDQLNGGDGTADVAVFTGTFLSYVITLNPVTSAHTLVSLATGTDVASNIESFQFADVTKTLAELIGSDTTAPLLSGTSPADGAIGVDVNGTITLTFSESMKAGSGAITIHRANGTVVHTIAASDTGQVTYGATTVVINPTADFDYNTSYYLNIAPGALEDQAGNDFAGITGSTALDFTTDVDDYSNDILTSGVVTVGGAAASGGVNFNDDEDLFRVALTAGQTYVFELRASGSPGLADPQLVLYNSLKQSQASDDNSGGGLDARIVFTAATGGNFYLGANDAGTGTGHYTLSAVTAAVVAGTAGHDSLTGSAGTQLIRGLAGNDTLRGNAGNDILEGGDGIDTAVFGSARASYTLTAGAALTIQANAGTDGTDKATGVERLRFTDGGLAMDLDGNAGIVARTLGAVFGDGFVTNTGYVKAGLEIVDSGVDFTTLMGLAINLVLGPNASNADVVTRLYTNVIGSPPSPAELQAFTGLLDSGTFTKASLGVFAAQTVFNDANIGMTGLAQTGLAFDL